MRARLLLLGLSLASLNAYGFSWPDLWSRPDQRAQALVDAGRAAEAIPLFADGRHKAYAEIKARRYREAAKRLQPFADPVSEYNRGNALARAGELPAALGAYDAALQRAPTASSLYRDARHNRDLVARQLQSQKSPPPRKNDQQGKNGQGQGQGQQQSAGQQHGQGQQSQAQGQQSQVKRQQPPDQGQPQGQGQQPNQGRLADQRPQQSQRPGGGQQPQGNELQSDQSQAPASQAEQAERDAAAALGRAPAELSGGKSPPPRPESEQAMALDQWLRWIPDDPAGLLRRKFMIEHMQKQQDAQR